MARVRRALGGKGMQAGAAAAHALYAPHPARVRADARGAPLRVDGMRVLAIRETWLLEDRWWDERPLRRRYWELVDERGRNAVVFWDLQSGGWFRQL